MTDLIYSSLFKKLKYLKDNYQAIIERLSDIGACSTMEKIKKDCGIKITILDELTALVEDSPDWQNSAIVEKVHDIIRRGSKQDERNAIVQIDLIKESSHGSKLINTLFEMYRDFSGINGWKTILISSSYSKKDLLKSLTFKVSGKGIIKYLKYESGYHEAVKDNRHSRVAVTVYPETQKKISN